MARSGSCPGFPPRATDVENPKCARSARRHPTEGGAQRPQQKRAAESGCPEPSPRFCFAMKQSVPTPRRRSASGASRRLPAGRSLHRGWLGEQHVACG
jgi:hypothetical protein